MFVGCVSHQKPNPDGLQLSAKARMVFGAKFDLTKNYLKWVYFSDKQVSSAAMSALLVCSDKDYARNVQ